MRHGVAWRHKSTARYLRRSEYVEAIVCELRETSVVQGVPGGELQRHGGLVQASSEHLRTGGGDSGGVREWQAGFTGLTGFEGFKS